MRRDAAVEHPNLVRPACLVQRRPHAERPLAAATTAHRQTFLALTAEINTLAEANQELLTAGQRAVRETLMIVADSAQTYGRRGETVAAAPRTRLIDEAM